MKRAYLAGFLAAVAIPAFADVTLYGRPGFEGRSLTVVDEVRNLLERIKRNREGQHQVLQGEMCPYQPI